jgi:hypothetical protein
MPINPFPILAIDRLVDRRPLERLAGKRREDLAASVQLHESQHSSQRLLMTRSVTDCF